MAQAERIPNELEPLRKAAFRAISPVKPSDDSSVGVQQLFFARRTTAGRELPPYYLVHFLLVDLLGFDNRGQFEKVAWSVPIDFNGQAFAIEHRKMGLGIFSADPETDEDAAREIVVRIKKAVAVAQPFFDWLAADAVGRSTVNVANNSAERYSRYQFLLHSFRQKEDEAIRRKDERIVKEGESPGGGSWQSVSFPSYQLRREAQWLAPSVVEAFFSWTEHVLIHLAILTGRISNAAEVTTVAEADWSEKFKQALDIGEPKTKQLFDRLLRLRRELRNYVAHGAFGKDGEAFSFHSGAGTAPVLLPRKARSRKFRMGSGLTFNAAAALELLKEFEALLWLNGRAAAKIYIQDHELPAIMPMAANGTYARAMASEQEMQEFVNYMNRAMDDSANMDW
jgi:hypothetical protein